ncbi:hypothetical protein DP113_34185 (plasmid) [Brasilonema octagenarum UFV-E1]|uniref:DUF4159 domain-containing protein n=2 Tax=Brasilonema TaxID=383614 RepID=A0A856MMX2_9CYAN|nr:MULTISPECIES: DUF4159 domain-containing protein [Brasilonema]NMF62521.1 hypothetical protein [Brasilonema octagenarum UFV-OR1]QDL12773.1 hypothetical protein DP114_34075 [Brasilonema sennae CENA114]QDL19169.1 hypothetical protein DP113_34185 [Brasilonema octagenarum UFV-E1]
MTHPFPPPTIKPLERLHPTDGLLINAERWRKAHDYHLRRQNAHYQSLNQPGIVCGLGVRVIPAPRQVEARYRDERWVQIQPGIAIDLMGHVIVVPNVIDFRIATEVTDTDPVTVYLVVSYVDPDQLRREVQGDVVQETFRIDEKSTLPNSSEVEICRVILPPGPVSISQPSDVFFPGYNDIDLRFRNLAQARPQAIIRMAQVNHSDSECSRNFFQLSYLLQAIEPLYPFLRGTDEVYQVTLEENIQDYDLLYLTGQQALSLNSPELESLKKYISDGGVLLVDAPISATALIESVQSLAQQLDCPLKPLEEWRKDHPLRTKPFLFAALPIINQQNIQLQVGGGIILSIGDLASAWGLDKALSLPRLTIRTAQELGINILNYAWKRRQLTGLQKEDYAGQW